MKTDMDYVIAELRRTKRERENEELRARLEKETVEELFRALCGMRGLMADRYEEGLLAG